MEFCLPAMAMPSYACGSSDWSSMGQMLFCPPTLDQVQTAGLRKRGWGDADGSEDGRLVRQRAEGAGISVGVSTEGVYAWHGDAPGIRYHGLSTSSYGLLGQGAFDQHQQTLNNKNPPQHQQPIQPLQSLQTAVEPGLQLPQRNAFHVLMTAAPMKVEGIVCSSCLTQEARHTAPCFHCGRLVCGRCLKQCARCSDRFCSHCSTVNYNGRFEQEMCFACNMSA